MPKHNQQLGQHGETLACTFLEQQQYQILERNFRTKFGEIDIIAHKDCEIIFFEVKTRLNKHFGVPSEIISSPKLQRLEKCAWYYLRQTQQEHVAWSIKVIEVFQGQCTLLEILL
jgi:putative endonuclease